MEKIKALIRKGRFLEAKKCYECELSNVDQTTIKDEDQEEVEVLLEKCAQVEKALKASDGRDWTHGCTRDGITATYNPEADGSYSVCMHGTQEDVPMFEEFATLVDVERYQSWFPLCNLSKIIHASDNLSALLHIGISTPFLTRDVVVHSWMADCLEEERSVVFFVRSVKRLVGVQIPPPTQSFMHDRGDCKNMILRLTAKSPSVVEVYAELNVHLKISLPQWLLAFIINNLLSVLFPCAKARAIEIREGPTRAAAQHISTDGAFQFFDEVVLSRMNWFYRSLGWGDLDDPPCLAAKREKHATRPLSPQTHIGDASMTAIQTQPSLCFVQRKAGVLRKLGLGLFFRPWATRYFTLRVSADPSSHEPPLLTYYTVAEPRKKMKELPITAGMTVQLVGAGGHQGWDPYSFSGPKGVGVLLTYGFKYAGRTEMLLVTDTLSDANEWVREIASAIEHNDRHLASEAEDTPGNSLAAEEFRKSIASCMGLLAEDGGSGHSEKVSRLPRRESDTISRIFVYICSQVMAYGISDALLLLCPLLPLLVPQRFRPIMWIVMLYACIVWLAVVKASNNNNNNKTS